MEEDKGKLRGYYVYYETNTDFAGVKKKVDSQISVFNQYFECEKIVVSREKKSILRSIIWRLPFASFGRNYEDVFEGIKQEPDFLYIRLVPIDRKFAKFLCKLRVKYPRTKILLEIATYPYQRELLADFAMLPFFFKDLIYRKKAVKNIDRIVTYADDKRIWNVPTVHVQNGVQVDKIMPIMNEENNDTIILFAVANFQKSHGYERCIKGLKDYYMRGESRKIELHFVGSGAEVIKYRKLVTTYGLEEYVFFYGMQKGESLENVYNKADIGLGAFGLYKRKLQKVSTLKTPEYLAKGLPVAVGFQEEVFTIEPTKYACEFPNNASNIDMSRIVEFYDSIYNRDMSRKAIREEIRDYARQMVDLQKVMQPVVDYILQN